MAEQRINGTTVRTLGSGRTLAGARTRARMEMIERLSGFFDGDELRVRASRRELGDAAIDANDVLLFSKKQMPLLREVCPEQQQILRSALDDESMRQRPQNQLNFTCSERSDGSRERDDGSSARRTSASSSLACW